MGQTNGSHNITSLLTQTPTLSQKSTNFDPSSYLWKNTPLFGIFLKQKHRMLEDFIFKCISNFLSFGKSEILMVN
jgi:hypothetical protein